MTDETKAPKAEPVKRKVDLPPKWSAEYKALVLQGKVKE